MVSKPAIVGVLGGVTILAALGLNFWLVPGDDDADEPRVETVAVPSKPTVPSAKSTSPSGASSATSDREPASAAAPAPSTSEPKTDPAERRPSFDIVRVDPDGNAVIAGRARPNAEVTIMDGDREVGSVTSDERGEWVFLPDQPLGAGQFALTLRQDGTPETAESEEAVVLVVPEAGKDIAGRDTDEPSQPLAMVLPRDEATPGGARILQAPDAGPQDSETGPAATAEAPATDAAPSASSSDTTASTATAAATTASAGGADMSSPTADDDRATPETVAAAPDRSAPDAGASQTTPMDTASAAASQAAASQAADPKVVAPQATAPQVAAAPDAATVDAAAPPSAVGDPSDAPKIQAFPQPAAAPSAADQSQPGQVTKSGDVSVDVIEYDDKGEVVFGGRTEPNADVEVFIDNKPAGSATADAEGRWQLRPDEPVKPGNYNLRVDKVSPSGTVKARVAFPFVRAAPLKGLPNDRLVVIQPGNNLWLIATRVYGEGLRYVEIHDANRDQIQNPDLIFPGQVFGLPTVN